LRLSEFPNSSNAYDKARRKLQLTAVCVNARRTYLAGCSRRLLAAKGMVEGRIDVAVKALVAQGSDLGYERLPG
jgi:hypothetical protein